MAKEKAKPDQADAKAAKKAKQAKKKEKKAPVPGVITIDDFGRVQMRVADVISCEKYIFAVSDVDRRYIFT